MVKEMVKDEVKRIVIVKGRLLSALRISVLAGIFSIFSIFSTFSLLFSPTSFAAAFQFYELGTPIIGSAAVGQAAIAYDASIAYFNPAGMTQLPASQYMLGTQLMLPYTNFSKSAATTILGDNGGNAGNLVPGVNLYYVYSYTPQVKLGISLTGPYGGLLNYTNGWVGRFIVQQLQLYTLNLNPAIAYQFNNWASIGAGVSVEYASLFETIALPLTPLTTLADGQANLKLDNTSAGFNVGLMLLPCNSTRIGLAYRSQITHRFHGNVTFLRISATPNTKTSMIMPQNIILSAAQHIYDKFSLLGELGWSNWSSMQNTIVTINQFSATIPRHWHDTYRVGLATQYEAFPGFLLQTGVSYDSSPTSSSHRTPDLPMDRQIRVGAGLIYSLYRAVEFGFSYEYINLGKASINNVSSNGALVGSYSRNYNNVLQISMNAAC